MDIGKLIEAAMKLRASDIHLVEGSAPYFRIDTILRAVDLPPVSREQMASFISEVLPERLKTKLDQRRGVDIGFQYKDVARCRIIAYYERHKLTAVFRLIPIQAPNFADFELPGSFAEYADFHRGMIIVAGPTGCGKSTTLAAMIDWINENKRVSVITIEDPIEFIYPNKNAVVTQREVGEDVEDFATGLVQGLRQDPDVILVGEMRDLDTMTSAIRAAETGHLLLTTLHTSGTVKAIERIQNTFPDSQRTLIHEQLAANLRVVLVQELLRRIAGHGRIAAFEILAVTEYVAKLIAEDRILEIYEVIKTGHDGMQTLDQGLAQLIRAGKVTEEEGLRYSHDPHALHRYVKGIHSTGDSGGVPE